MLDWIRNRIRSSKKVQKLSEDRPLTAKDKIRKKYDAYYVGQIIHYFSKIKVGIIRMEKGRLCVGDSIYVQGHTSRFKQKVTSIEYNHKKVRQVGPGYEVGIRFGARVREADDVYMISS